MNKQHMHREIMISHSIWSKSMHFTILSGTDQLCIVLPPVHGVNLTIVTLEQVNMQAMSQGYRYASSKTGSYPQDLVDLDLQRLCKRSSVILLFHGVNQLIDRSCSLDLLFDLSNFFLILQD